ncbi:MAG: hypothetical protein ACR2I1_00425 [Propionibacteriaceae bacterium]
MTSTHPTGPSWVPTSCALPSAEQPLRVAEFDQLFVSSVEQVARTSRTTLRLTLSPEPDVAATAAGLVTRESRCCGFFTFALTIAPLSLVLDIRVPSDRVDVLDALELRAGGLVR